MKRPCMTEGCVGKTGHLFLCSLQDLCGMLPDNLIHPKEQFGRK